MPAIYGILDTVALDFVQNVLTICRHDAPMVRMFTDLLANKQGPIGQHPADHQLVKLGHVDLRATDHTEPIEYILDGNYAVILDGKAWLAMQGDRNGQEATTTSPRTPRMVQEISKGHAPSQTQRHAAQT